MVAAVVHEGRSLADVAPEQLSGLSDERDRGLAQACAYGVLRHYHALRARLAPLLERPLKRKDADLEALLLVGLFQLDTLGVPAHAAVSATVDGARLLGKSWACRMVNAVLRAAQRRPAPPTPSPAEEYPAWLVAQVRMDWPKDAEEIFAAGLAQAPMTLRVNPRRSSVEVYLRALSGAGIVARRGLHSPAALILQESVPVTMLPGFAEGSVTVQDEAAQLAALLLSPTPGERVLDACAAPGGKTTHLLELGDDSVEVLALDASPARLQRVSESLARLGMTCQLAGADAGTPASWWDGKPFDRILLDAPCSALGVTRRRPDIRLRRTREDLETLGTTQLRLLDALWPLLRPGGTLLYATCSIMAAENDAIIAAFIAHTDDVEVTDIAASWGRQTRFGRQILPGENDMDGFYYALLRRHPRA